MGHVFLALLGHRVSLGFWVGEGSEDISSMVSYVLGVSEF